MSTLRYLTTLVLALAVLPISVRADTVAQPWPCDRSDVNLYDYHATTVERCGYRVFPVDHIRARPDGGKEYVYVVEGHPLVRRMVPPGFDPATAADQQLANYGFPPRPSDPGEAARWRDDVRRIHPAAPTPFVIETNIRAGLQTGPCTVQLKLCWGGYIADNGTAFTSSYIDYYEPGQAQSACTGDGVAVWTGIGGLNGSNVRLAQAGTFPHVGGGIADHQAFEEVLPDQPNSVLMTPVSARGDDVRVTVTWVSPGYNIHVYDATNGQEELDYISTSSYDAGSAEWIVERPQYNQTIVPLRNFWTGWTVNSAQANSIGMQNFPPLVKYNIQNKSGATLETTANNSADSFTAGWNQCG